MNKTKSCKYFSNDQSCPYGERCRFLHGWNESDALESRSAPHGGHKAIRKKAYYNKDNPPRHEREINPLSVEQQSRSDGRIMENLNEREQPQVKKYNLRNDPMINKPSSEVRSTRSEVVPQCRYFLYAHCKYGDKCKYYHPGSDKEKVAPNPGVVTDVKRFPLCPSNKCISSSSVQDYQKQQRSHNPPPLTLASFIGRGTREQSSQKPSRTQKEVIDKNLREVELEQLQARFPGDACSLLSKSKYQTTYLIQFSPTDPNWRGASIILMEVSFPESYPKNYCFVELSSGQELDQEVIAEGNKAIKNYWTTDVLGTLMFRPFLRWWDKNIVQILSPFFPSTANETANEDVIEVVSTDEDDDTRAMQPVVKSKRGTEIRLVGLELSQTLGTAFWTTIKIALSCSRCKNHREAEIKEERLYSITCDHCNSNMSVIYHLALVHPGSSTLGYLELTRSTPVEVVFQFSSLTVTCLNCSNEVITKGFFIGQPKDVYCHKCHVKMTLNATGVRFLQHQQSDSITLNAETITLLSSSKKKNVDNLLKDGQPLPDYGICQHYKKSHRWLRFPCCGRAFPCDVCHDSVQDHIMERATRMLCGYCSKEQDYSGKGICVRCGADLVSSKRSTHWEGGTGCRNKVKMSRDDKQKYKNSDTKTVCKKEQRVGKKANTYSQ